LTSPFGSSGFDASAEPESVDWTCVPGVLAAVVVAVEPADVVAVEPADVVAVELADVVAVLPAVVVAAADEAEVVSDFLSELHAANATKRVATSAANIRADGVRR
jgi:hypothetical protein